MYYHVILNSVMMTTQCIVTVLKCINYNNDKVCIMSHLSFKLNKN